MSATRSATCPEIVELERLAAGEVVADGIHSHLSECESCRSAVGSIKNNNLLIRDLVGASRAGLETPPSHAAWVAIPGYRILSTIKSGGQGVVFRAEQQKTRRIVALKVLLGGSLATARQRARFEREVELVAALRHPNIVTLFDSGTTPDGHPYYAMEFVDGVPLDQYRVRQMTAIGANQTPVVNVLGTCATICDAVHFAHQRGIVHRDLKPANILIDQVGQPRILDFGLAKVMDDDPVTNGITFSGEFMGTFAYASPEQAAGQPDLIDIRTDVYSLGVILFEMLTGQMPYPAGGSMASAIRNITEARPSVPSHLRKDLGNEVDTIVLKALAKEPARRYQSAGELLRDIRHFLAGEPIDAKRDSAWYVLRKMLYFHRWKLSAAGTVAIMLLVTGLAVVSARFQAARSGEATARALEESNRADAFSLVLHAARSPKAANRGAESYAQRDLARLYHQIRLGWLGANPDREFATASLLSAFYRDSGSPHLSEELLRQESVQRTIRSGSNLREQAKRIRSLAEVLLVRNRLGEALKYGNQALESDWEVQGEDSIEVARDKDLLARINLAQGNYESAERLANDAVAVQSRELGAESLELAASLDTHANSLMALKRVEPAETECLRALRIRLAFLQDEHPDVIQSLRRLADIEERQPESPGDRHMARAIGAESFASFASALRELARGIEVISQTSVGGESDPRQILRQHLRLKAIILGPMHNGLLSTMVALCVEAQRAGDPAEADELLTRALPIIEANQGGGSLAYANCLELRAEHRFNLGRTAEAIEDAEKSVDIWWAIPDEWRDNLLAAANERLLALQLAMGGQYERAALRFQHCIDVLRREKGPENNVLIYALAGRAWAIMHLGQAEEAERIVRDAFDRSERIGNTMPSDQRTQIRYYLGSILAACKKYDEAEIHLNAAWEGNHGGEALKDWPAQSLLRLHIIDDMLRICRARGDVESEARWRKERSLPN